MLFKESDSCKFTKYRMHTSYIATANIMFTAGNMKMNYSYIF